MKTIRVLVLLLLASVHVFTPVLSDEPVKPPQAASTTAQAAPTASTTAQAAPAAAPTTPTAAQAAPAAPATPEAAPAAAPTTPTAAQAAPAAPATPEAAPAATPIAAQAATAAAPAATSVASTAPRDATRKTPDTLAAPTTEKTASPTAASADHRSVTSTSVVAQTNNETLKKDTLQPKSHHPSNPGSNSETLTDIKINETRGPDDSTEKPNTDKGTPTPAQVKPKHENEKTKEKGPGSQSGIDEKVPPKADKRLWWIVLPALLVGAAAAIVLKFKCKKIHDHSETIDTGTENASFQSRPESTKDGVMLLGVKSSGAEENAAAR